MLKYYIFSLNSQPTYSKGVELMILPRARASCDVLSLYRVYKVEQTLNFAAVSLLPWERLPADLLPGTCGAQLHILPPVSFTCRKQLGQRGSTAPPATKTCRLVAVENAAVPRCSSLALIMIMRSISEHWLSVVG